MLILYDILYYCRESSCSKAIFLYYIFWEKKYTPNKYEIVVFNLIFYINRLRDSSKVNVDLHVVAEFSRAKQHDRNNGVTVCK